MEPGLEADDDSHTITHRTFSPRGLSSRILSNMLDELYTLGDVEVVVSGKSFQCHRAVLSALSPVFRAMFQSQMIESKSGKLEISEFQPDVFLIMRDYMYGKPLRIRNDVAVAVSTFARQYQIDIPQLPDYLDKLLSSALTLDNVIAVRQHADSHSAHRLRRNCDRFITVRMKALANTEAFLSAPPEAAKATLNAPTNVSRETLSRQCAQYVFCAAIAWVAYDEAPRLAHLDTVLSTVDVDGLSLPSLVRATRNSIAMQSSSFQTRLFRAFARRAEQDLGLAQIARESMAGRRTGFAFVGEDDVEMSSAPTLIDVGLYSGSLSRLRRRTTFSGSFVHHRFPSAPGNVGGRRIHFTDDILF